MVQLETFHEGDLPMKKGFISVSAENVLLSALKQGYDGDCTVIRLYESLGRETETQVTFMGYTFTASFGPYELKTFRLKDGQAEEADLLEMPL